MMSMMVFSNMELPPRARRIPSPYFLQYFSTGTTSACAENTGGNQHFCVFSRNYLRVRGEYTGSEIQHKDYGELPPRARRILDGILNQGIVTGTTSACAENTLNELGLL